MILILSKVPGLPKVFGLIRNSRQTFQTPHNSTVPYHGIRATKGPKGVISLGQREDRRQMETTKQAEISHELSIPHETISDFIHHWHSPSSFPRSGRPRIS